MPLRPVLSKIIEWLRAGYPEGVPDVDYIPLFALLGSQLTNEDVSLIATELEAAAKHLSSAKDLRQAVEDLGWVLINSKEFLFRH